MELKLWKVLVRARATDRQRDRKRCTDRETEREEQIDRAARRRLGERMAVYSTQGESGQAGDLQAGKISEGSFSVVSTPIFASQDSFESSRRDLHFTHLYT